LPVNPLGSSAESSEITHHFEGDAALEPLESRILLTLVNWVGGSGDWNTGSNWSNGTGPGAGDDVVIDQPGITVSHSTGSHTVQSLTVSDAFTLSGGALSVTGGLTLNNANVKLSVEIFFTGTQTLGGTGTVTFVDGSGGSGLNISAGSTLTIAPGITIHGNVGYIGRQGINSSLVNQGTITADIAGGSIRLFGIGWSNSGTIQAIGGGSVEITGSWTNTGTITAAAQSTVNLGGTFGLADLGTIAGISGIVNITGTLNNNGTLALDQATTGSWRLAEGGTILGGIVSTAANTALGGVGVNTGGTLAGVTLAGTLDMTGLNWRMTVTGGLTLNNAVINLGQGSQLIFAGTQTLGGTGNVVFTTAISEDTGLQIPQGSTLTIAPGITVHGKTGFIGGTPASKLTGSFINQGNIIADGGGTISLDGVNWRNAGSIIGMIGGFILLDGTLDNRGSTLALDDTTGSYYLSYGTILGGTVSTTGSAKLIGLAHVGTLAGVTLAGTLDVASFGGAAVIVTGALTLNNGSIELAARSRLIFQGTQTLMGTCTVTFSGVATDDSALLVPGNGDTLTIAPGITVRGNSGFVGSVTGGALINQGTITAQSGGTLTVQGIANFAGGTLTGGTWQAVGNSTLRLLGADVVTNTAGILLDGAASHLYSDAGTTNALAGLATNATTGSLTISNGANLSTGIFNNQGSLTVGLGSTFTASGNYTTGGSTIVDGALVANNTVTVSSGGNLSGSGTVSANIANNGLVSPGSSPGILTVNGDYSQASTGVLNIEIGGTTAGSQYDQLSISGLATLAGTLNIRLINGFGPIQGQSFTAMSFGSHSGSFATINGLKTGSFTLFNANLGATDLFLNAAGTASDLAFDSMTIPASGTSGQNATVQYTVRNRSIAPALGDWFDSVFLTAGPTFDPNAQLLGRVHHSGDVVGLGSYTETLTAPVPNLVDGGYHIIVMADSRGLIPDSNRSNNTGISPNALHVSGPVLTVGVPITGTIKDGQDLYFHLVIPPGQTVMIGADFATVPEAEFNLRYNALPDRSTFDQTAPDLFDPQPRLFLPSPQGAATTFCCTASLARVEAKPLPSGPTWCHSRSPPSPRNTPATWVRQPCRC
jgi:hypothetical protein